jgi:hypothetical protein
MSARKNQDPNELRKIFLNRCWAILLKYLERLDDAELIANTDARSGAGVVKTLFDAVDKAQNGTVSEEEYDDLPKIPEAILDEFIERILETQTLEEETRKRSGAQKPCLSHPATAQYQA